MKKNMRKGFFVSPVRTTRRALLSMLMIGGALTLVGCGSDSGAACEDGWHRNFACGVNLDGLQPQQCVDGKWESINFCALPDGTKHPEADDYPYNPDAGKGSDVGNNDAGNNDAGNNGDSGTIDDPTVTRPTSPDECIELVDADVNGGKTLSSEDCYVVSKDLLLQEGTLTIEPGTTLLFKKDVHFVIKNSGRLNAAGESGKAIWFEGTQKEKGFWGGLVFTTTGSGENNLTSVVVRHAGGKGYSHQAYTYGGVYVNDGAKLNVSDSLFEQNLYAGLNVVSGDSVIDVESSTFKNNEVAVRVTAHQLSMLKDGLVLEDNTDVEGDDSNYIVLEFDAKISKNGTWPAYTYRNNSNIEINSAISIAPGAVFQNAKEKQITVTGDNASLKAEGTAEQPIIFTSRNESSSSWRGIQFDNTNSPDNSLKHVVIEKGGDSGYSHQAWAAGALFVRTDNVILALDNVTFRNNANMALNLYANEAKVTLDNSTFISNGFPITTAVNHIGSFGENLTFEGGEDVSIRVAYGAGVSKAATWFTYTVPYEVSTIINVDAPLTLSSGSTFIFHADIGISVKGLAAALTAKAESGARITMKGLLDVKGTWRGVHFNNAKNPLNELDGVDITNAGQSGWSHQAWAKAGLLLNGDSSVKVSNTAITGSNGYGVSVVDASELVGCDGVSVTGSTTGDFNGITSLGDCK